MSSSPELTPIVEALLAPGKGVLAADESFPTIGKRFQALGIPSTEEHRRAYRELLLTTPGLGAYISGVILFDETLHQQLAGASAASVLSRQDMIPGIKVDQGTIAFPASSEEKITHGLEGLAVRLAEYRSLGARFTKWRAVITISDGLPTKGCLVANAQALGRFARLSQEAGLVPIVEPEVLMDGDHSLARCAEVAHATLDTVFATLAEHRVALGGMLLKTGMVLPGKESANPASLEQVAEATLQCLRRSVPTTVPGIVFLSGGQSDVEATQRLNAICRAGAAPWKLSFSYGRALQDAALKTWQGLPDRAKAAQAALLHRARCNSLAVQGNYSPQDEHFA